MILTPNYKTAFLNHKCCSNLVLETRVKLDRRCGTAKVPSNIDLAPAPAGALSTIGRAHSV